MDVGRTLKALVLRLGPGAATHSETRTPYYELADRVDLVHHARAAGLQNLPSTSATSPNDVECAIEHEFRNRNQAALEAARGDLKRIAEDFAAVEDQLPSIGDLRVVSAEAEADLESQLATDQSITNTRRELQLRHRDERAFRRRHDLGREARYPASRLLHLGVVGVMAVVESVLNTGFFASTSAFGLVGGFLVAVGVSLANVASGLVAGFIAFRHFHARPRVQRTAAVAAVSLYVASATVFNLAVAHLRDLTAPTQEASRTALAAALQHPLSLSAVSAGLLILGLVVSAIAAWHGYTLDDPCPGYGDVTRARRRAAETFGAADQALRTRALARTEAVPTRCRELVLEAHRLVGRLRQLAVQAQQRVEHHETERAHNQHWCTVLLRLYRTENETVRTSPPPVYFAVYPSLPSELGDGSAEDLSARLNRASDRLDALAEASHASAVEQPRRVDSARRRLDEFVRQAVGQADAGRGDGTEVHHSFTVYTDERGAS